MSFRSDENIESLAVTEYNEQVPIVTQPEAEVGTLTDVKRWTPERVKQAILALAPGGGSIEAVDETTSLTTALKKITWKGAGVTVTEPVADEVEVTIPGGGGGGGDLGTRFATSSSYTVLDGDGYGLIEVTAGATTKVITLPTLADNLNRQITVVKEDTGIGKVQLDGEGAETINFGSDFLTVSCFIKGDSITVRATANGWKVVGWNIGFQDSTNVLTYEAGYSDQTLGTKVKREGNSCTVYLSTIKSSTISAISYVLTLNAEYRPALQIDAYGLAKTDGGASKGFATYWIESNGKLGVDVIPAGDVRRLFSTLIFKATGDY